MKPRKRPQLCDANEEVSSLIETLHTADRRLEELTAGEVDTVSDRDGRTLFLRRAQDRMRYSEAAKQAAILNALPAHIAFLDAQGLIVSVNETWRRFATANGLEGTGHGIGLNYLEICDRAQGKDSSEAHQVAEGIRLVLRGELQTFSLEYACHSPAQQRWFQLTVTPLTDADRMGAVVTHRDVTAERQSADNLSASELRFRQMADNIGDVFCLQNLDASEIYYVSPAYEQIWGRTCSSLYADPISWRNSIHPDDLDDVRARGTAEFDSQYRIVRPDGEIRWIHARGFPILDAAGNPYRMAGVASDITVRKQGEIKINRLNRVFAMLSQINALIVRVTDRDELFREACRIAVNAGAFRMAWIGVIDPKTLDGKVVAWSGGEGGFLDNISLTARAGTPDSERPACRALRQSRPVICNDIATDASVAQVRDVFLKRGHRSAGCFPISATGRPDAVIVLYAGESNAFDDEETALLRELSGNISFALDHIERGKKLDFLAYYDVLTGLANRKLFLERVAQYQRSAISAGHKVAVVLLDLERFQNINDSLGQAGGDALLRQVAEWLTLNVGDVNLLARVDADHFAAVLPEVTDEGDVARLLDKMIQSFTEHPFRLNDAVLRVAAKFGVALFPDDGADADTLFKRAEAALKKAKASGERYLFYAQKMTAAVAGKLTLENQLRQALDKEEFVLHYQPKVNLATGKVSGAEALIRWNDPRTGLVPPGRFIPILEETGLIYEVGRWALRQAIDDYLRWCTAGLPAVRIAVNVSALQLRNRGFVDEIKLAIAGAPHAAAGLELEITESMIMDDVQQSIASLKAIRAMNVGIALDDFGTGFSSLSHLSNLPVDTLKVDRSFVVGMTASSAGLALVSTIIDLAHSLKLKVVGEGVETDEQQRLLRLLNCDEMQGFLFSKPVPSGTFEERFLAPGPPVTNNAQTLISPASTKGAL